MRFCVSGGGARKIKKHCFSKCFNFLVFSAFRFVAALGPAYCFANGKTFGNQEMQKNMTNVFLALGRRGVTSRKNVFFCFFLIIYGFQILHGKTIGRA